MAKTTAAQQRAVHKYVKNNYDRLELSVPKGEKKKFSRPQNRRGKASTPMSMRRSSAAWSRSGLQQKMRPGGRIKSSLPLISEQRVSCMFSPEPRKCLKSMFSTFFHNILPGEIMMMLRPY